jgi:flavin-dependent dehydrogenase
MIPSDCQVLVVGAGPAGGATACKLAELGLHVLVVDAKPFPRPKVCGGCLNGRSIASLKQLGVLDQLIQRGAIEVNQLRLVCRGNSLIAPLPPTLAVRRETMDDVVIQKAISRGAVFLPGISAHVEGGADSSLETRAVQLRSSTGSSTLRASIVVCADGLGHPSLTRVGSDPSNGLRCVVRSDSRVGLQALLPLEASEKNFPEFPAGRLTMVAGTDGYVGLTQVDGGFLNIAAAVSRKALSEKIGSGEPSFVIKRLIAEAGLSLPASLEGLRWTGTPALTQTSTCVALRRIFLVGDACGYVEPFTGEGMAWALAGAEALAPIVRLGCEAWSDELIDQWQSHVEQQIRSRQWMCHQLANLLRRPRLTRWVLALCQFMPMLPRYAIQIISGPGDHVCA